MDHDGLLRHNNALYVPEDPAVCQELISRCHNDSLAGHFGPVKTKELLDRKFFGDGSLRDAETYCRTCDIYARESGSLSISRMES